MEIIYYYLNLNFYLNVDISSLYLPLNVYDFLPTVKENI